ncbi:MAG TPA: Maf family protein, partial [bacterium]|nr:Maf family protein [bacterium]
LNSKEPYDKAGAYDIQGTAAGWIKKWEGDYFNVMGLPIQWVVQQIELINCLRKS